jgi:hypothetical protein
MTQTEPPAAAKEPQTRQGVFHADTKGAALFASDGKREWFMKLNGLSAPPAFDQGLVVACGKNWIMSAYRVTSAVSVLAPGAISGRYNIPADAENAPVMDAIEAAYFMDRVETALKAGEVGALEKWYACGLIGIAGTLSALRRSRIPLVNGTFAVIPPTMPTGLRARALSLLGQLGSAELIPYLTTFLGLAREPALKTAAIGALGTIGVDPDGISLACLFRFVSSYASLQNTPALLAAAYAVGRLSLFASPTRVNVGVRALTTLAACNRPGPASAALSALRNLGYIN